VRQLQAEETAAWQAAAAAGYESLSAGEAVLAVRERLCSAQAALEVHLRKQVSYASLSRSVDEMQAALMPCGMVELPDYTVTGVRAALSRLPARLRQRPLP